LHDFADWRRCPERSGASAAAAARGQVENDGHRCLLASMIGGVPTINDICRSPEFHEVAHLRAAPAAFLRTPLK
jgi:hypothetical protein